MLCLLIWHAYLEIKCYIFKKKKKEKNVILDKMYARRENLVFYPKKSTKAGEEDLFINLALGERDFTRA